MGRINALVISYIILGIFLIVSGLYGNFAGDVNLGYVSFGFGTVLVTWAIIRIAFNIGTKRSLCLKCGHKVARREQGAFTDRWGVRKASPCPGCQTVLIRAKWPWRIINACPWILFAYVCALIVTGPGASFFYLSFALLIVFAVSFEFGMATLRFEIVDEPTESS